MNTDDRIIQAFQNIASIGGDSPLDYKKVTKSDLFEFVKRMRHISKCMLKEIEDNNMM